MMSQRLYFARISAALLAALAIHAMAQFGAHRQTITESITHGITPDFKGSAI
jgi:hypothetical protein